MSSKKIYILLIMMLAIINNRDIRAIEIGIPVTPEIAAVLTFDPGDLAIAMQARQPFYPFARLKGLPGMDTISNIAFTNVAVESGLGFAMPIPPIYVAPGVQDQDGFQNLLKLTIRGDTTILNVRVRASITFQARMGSIMATSGPATTQEQLDAQEKAAKEPSGHFGFVLKAQIPDTWKISDSIPDLKGSDLDKLTFSKMEFLISTMDYFDNDLKLQVGKNSIGIGGIVDIAGPLGPITKILKVPSEEIIIGGTIGPRRKDLGLRASLNVPFNFTGDLAKRLKSGMVMLEITGSPSIALLTDIAVQTDNDPNTINPPLDFICRAGLGPMQAELSGTMKGMWKNPLGIPGIQIGNVALEMDFLYAELGIPTGIGLAGTINIGKTILKVAGKISENIKDPIVLDGEIAQLCLDDMCSWINLKIPVPALCIQNAKFYFVPFFGFLGIAGKGTTFWGARIGDLYFDPGITIACDMALGPITSSYLVNLQAMPLPGIEFHMQGPSLRQLTDYMISYISGKSYDSADNNKQMDHSSFLAANLDDISMVRPTLLAFSLGGAFETVKSGVEEAAEDVKSGVQTVVSAVEGVTQKVLDNILDFQVKNFEIILKASKQSIAIDVAIHKKEFSFEYEVSILGKAFNFIKPFAIDLVNKIKSVF